MPKIRQFGARFDLFVNHVCGMGSTQNEALNEAAKNALCMLITSNSTPLCVLTANEQALFSQKVINYVS